MCTKKEINVPFHVFVHKYIFIMHNNIVIISSSDSNPNLAVYNVTLHISYEFLYIFHLINQAGGMSS